MTKPNRVTAAYGFTIGFDGRSEFAPIAVQRFYNVELDGITIVCYGDVAELAFKHPERVRIDCKDCHYKVGLITRNMGNRSVSIQVLKE